MNLWQTWLTDLMCSNTNTKINIRWKLYKTKNSLLCNLHVARYLKFKFWQSFNNIHIHHWKEILKKKIELNFFPSSFRSWALFTKNVKIDIVDKKRQRRLFFKKIAIRYDLIWYILKVKNSIITLKEVRVINSVTGLNRDMVSLIK